MKDRNGIWYALVKAAASSAGYWLGSKLASIAFEAVGRKMDEMRKRDGRQVPKTVADLSRDDDSTIAGKPVESIPDKHDHQIDMAR
jgi:glycine cleavage system regulatory protein